MSTNRIKGTSGVIIDSTQYLELPKGGTYTGPLREGMIRYVVDDTDSNQDGIQILNRTFSNNAPNANPEWGRIVTSDPTTGKIDTAALPDSVTAGLDYQGQWNTNTPPTAGTNGRYWIANTTGTGYAVGDWLVDDGTNIDIIPFSSIRATNAGAVSFDSAGVRDKHGVADQSLQLQIADIIENAVDRNNTDTITGTLTFDNGARILFENGTVLAPSIALASDTNTGLYSVAADQLGVTTGGSNVATFTNGQLRLVNGSAAAPGYSFTNDTDTGIRLANVGEIAIVTSGADRLTVTSAGVELSKLILDAGTAAEPTLTFSGDTDTGIYRAAANEIGITAGGTRRLHIQTDRIDSAEPFYVPDGFLGYGFSSDDSTGMGYDGTQLHLRQDGRAIFEITSQSPSYGLGDSEIKFNGRMYASFNSSGVPAYAFQENPDSGMFYTGGVGISVDASEKILVTTDRITVREPLQINTGTSLADPIIRSGSSSQRMYFGGTGFAFSNSSGSATILETKNDEVLATVPFRGANGSQGTPTFSFDTDSDTGMYLGSTGVLSFTTGGADSMVLGNWITASKKGVRVTNGSATEPTFTFTNNADTGIFTDGTNLNITVGGTEVAEFTANGLTPSRPIALAGGTSALPSLTFNGDTNTGIHHGGENIIKFATAAVDRVTIDNNGLTSSQYLYVNNANGNLQIGAQNTSWTHFTANRDYYFNRNVSIDGNIKVHDHDTFMNGTDGKITENGSLLEDKYFRYGGSGTAANQNTLISDTKYNGVFEVANQTLQSGMYTYGVLTNLSTASGRFQMYAPHRDNADASKSDLWVRTGWSNDRKAWRQVMFADGKIDNAVTADRLSTYADLDARYVNIGGAITLALGADSLTATGLTQTDGRYWKRTDKVTNASNADTLGGNSYATVISNARSGLASTSYAYSKAEADGRYMRSFIIRDNTSSSDNTITNGERITLSGSHISWNWSGNTLTPTVRTGTTGQTGLVQLSTSVSSTSTTLAATPSAVRAAYNLAAGKMTQATGDGRYLGISAKAADSNLLDGIDSSAFLRSNANDTATGEITFNGRVNIRGHLDLSDNEYIYFGSGDDIRFFFDGSHMITDMRGTSYNWYIRDNGTNRFTFDDDGHFTASGNITAYSDLRLKKDLKVIPEALDKISQLSGYTYLKTSKIDGKEFKNETGLIAQQVKEVLPEAIHVDKNDEDGIMSVAYGNMVGLLVEGIKEEKAKREALEDRVAALEDLVQQLLNK